MSVKARWSQAIVAFRPAGPRSRVSRGSSALRWFRKSSVTFPSNASRSPRATISRCSTATRAASIGSTGATTLDRPCAASVSICGAGVTGA
jgi:hypothetical protein